MFEPISLVLFHGPLKLIMKTEEVFFFFFSKRTILLENVLINSFTMVLDTWCDYKGAPVL